METIKASDLKTILHSKRANIYYLEHCRLLVNSGRVEYVTEEGGKSAYWNIPIANTTTILLGTGTSVTQAAMREMAKAGVLAWVLGLPHGLSVLHGKTRRGGLVFDAADLIKDALVLPLAFIAAQRGDEDQEFRQACVQNFLDNQALDFMIDTLKAIAAKGEISK